MKDKFVHLLTTVEYIVEHTNFTIDNQIFVFLLINRLRECEPPYQRIYQIKYFNQIRWRNYKNFYAHNLLILLINPS